MSEEGTIIKSPIADGTFKGPLGLWPWPLVNLLVIVIDRLKGRSPGSGVARVSRTKITEVRPNSDGGWSILEHET